MYRAGEPKQSAQLLMDSLARLRQVEARTRASSKFDTALQETERLAQETISLLDYEMAWRAELETRVEDLKQTHGEFLALIARELRVPLTSVKGSISTLLERHGDLEASELREFHMIIDSQVDRMETFIGDLRDMAGIETGTLSVQPEPTDVALLLEEAKSSLVAGVFENILHVGQAKDLPWVMADRPRIVRALNILLAHAAEHSPESARISLQAVRQGSYVNITVSHEQMDPAPRLDRSPMWSYADGGRDPLGPGLDLAVCEGIVEAHGGTIWAEGVGASQPSSFTFAIPIAEEVWTSATGDPSVLRTLSSDSDIHGRVRILAVDDDPRSLMNVRNTISDAGYQAFVTGDPEEALRLMDEVNPHLVLLDLLLPETDGIELMDDLLQKGEVPIIFLSVYHRQDAISRALDAGAVDYIVKPFSPVELAARIRAALRAHGVLDLVEPFRMEDLEIDYAERLVTLAGHPLQLTSIEYRLLYELATNSGRVLTYDHLLRHVWGVAGDSDVRPMRTVVSNVRRKLGDDADSPTYIVTEPRLGYRMG